MKNYIAILKGYEGCDYSISCGIKIEKIQAENIQDAENKVIDLIRDDYSDFSPKGDNRINDCDIYEVFENTQVDVQKYRDGHLKKLKKY